MSVLSGKPRFYPMLKNERPACVTILTLARDAAAQTLKDPSILSYIKPDYGSLG